ncbi:MAG: hypothetical protein LBK02_02050, partial [Treponema sp.]|nr:hypothetical protein [Treponema sp.]
REREREREREQEPCQAARIWGKLGVNFCNNKYPDIIPPAVRRIGDLPPNKRRKTAYFQLNTSKAA